MTAPGMPAEMPTDSHTQVTPAESHRPGQRREPKETETLRCSRTYLMIFKLNKGHYFRLDCIYSMLLADVKP